MKKSRFLVFALIPLVFALGGIVSCSAVDSDDMGTISVSVNKSLIDKSLAARDSAGTTEETVSTIITLETSGDYNASKSITVSESMWSLRDEDYSVSIEVPVGATISLTASMSSYFPLSGQGGYGESLKGTSEKFTVQEGTNEVTIKMQHAYGY